MSGHLADRFTVALDLDGVTAKAGLMDRVARALALPDWFGRNWDALADTLSDPGQWPEAAAGRGLLIVVRGWRPYAESAPGEWGIAQDVFASSADATAGLRADGGPALAVVLALGDASPLGETS
ncbi:barstar family protein [Streptomyces sp. J2-1]|uniref:barstar family protein n=1 Tax=Streptomyces corallincola TaxID=2851888 RepID=UPI001C395BBA|nr:barstar family protein [Streptomyces corallincola]MBV2354520.1 barstar family protein [Streptomyces corallincola]